jgi:hypothetical protein
MSTGMQDALTAQVVPGREKKLRDIQCTASEANIRTGRCSETVISGINRGYANSTKSRVRLVLSAVPSALSAAASVWQLDDPIPSFAEFFMALRHVCNRR